MTVEELLKPRYKVIADYPGNHYGNIGTILDRDWAQYPNDDETQPAIWRISQYPHLFKKLKWWEERKLNDMPDYLGYSRWIGIYGDMSEFNGEYEEIVKVKRHHLKAFDGEKFLSDTGEAISYSVWYPATESQYLTFKNLNQ
jgi:hypothetical protein